GSPAIDAGDNALVGVATDQRGLRFARIAGGTVDIGAFEAQSLTLVVDSSADEDDGNYAAGDLSLREAITLANANPGADSITFDPAVFAAAQPAAPPGGPLLPPDPAGQTGISGPAAGVTVSGGNATRVFQVNAGATAALSGLTVSNGRVVDFGGGILNFGT